MDGLKSLRENYTLSGPYGVFVMAEPNWNRTGAPRSPKRTWAEKEGEAHNSFHLIEQQIQGGDRKSNRKYHFRPRYAEANLGHPSCSNCTCYDRDPCGTQSGEAVLTQGTGF